MPALSGIYDSAFLQPVARIKENISILQDKWLHYIVEYSEPIVPGPASIVEMVALAGLTSLAANATIAKRVVPILQVYSNELLHVRWFPLDNVEGVIWELAGQQKLASRNIHSRTDRRVLQWDPTLATTTFFIQGELLDMNLEVRNPMQYATPLARFVFFGNRMLLTPVDLTGLDENQKRKLGDGDKDTVRSIIGPTTWLPARGRQA